MTASGKKCSSVLYGCRDVVRSTDALLVICVVHVYVGEEPFTRKALEVVTKEATNWLGTDNCALYVLHVFPQTNNLDLSFSDNNSSLLVDEVETRGIQPFMQALARSIHATGRQWGAITSLFYDTLAELTSEQYDVAVAHDSSTEQHRAAIASFVSRCEKQ